MRAIPAAPARRAQLRRLAVYYQAFFDNLRVAYDLYDAGQSNAVRMTLERAYADLESGEQIARRLGAPECAVRPFEA